MSSRRKTKTPSGVFTCGSVLLFRTKVLWSVCCRGLPPEWKPFTETQKLHQLDQEHDLNTTQTPLLHILRMLKQIVRFGSICCASIILLLHRNL